MKKTVLILTLLFSIVGSCQQNELLTKENLKLELVNFLVKKQLLKNINEYNEDKRVVNLRGIHKNKVEDNLRTGIYAFSLNRTHNKAFFVIVDGNSYTILDLTSKEELLVSIKNTINFCEKQKYCVTITNDYVSRLIGVFYNINKNPNNRGDINCKTGVINTDDLP